MTKFNMIDWLQSTSLFFIHTHGKQTGFLIAPSVYLQTVDLVGEDLSNIECAVMLTCRTAMVGGGIQTNLIEQMVDCGAETVIGFEDYTQILDCNLFAERFAEMTLRDGRTVAYAVLYMNRDGFAGGICDDAVIEGNGQNIL